MKKKREELDSKILELWDLLPQAKLVEDTAWTKVNAAKLALEEHKKSILETKTHLETEFKQKNALLPSLVKAVDPALLKQYNAIKERTGGIGMADVTDRGTCSKCGTVLPTRTVVAVKEDKVTICESCHRILFSKVPSA